MRRCIVSLLCWFADLSDLVLTPRPAREGGVPAEVEPNPYVELCHSCLRVTLGTTPGAFSMCHNCDTGHSMLTVKTAEAWIVGLADAGWK